MPFPTGARPSPRHALCAAAAHKIVGVTPPQFLWLPSKLDIWGNDVHGDCVTAEEAFNKACSQIFISSQQVITWATAHGVLEGADLASVMSAFQRGGFNQDGNTYDDGSPSTVDWTSAPTLQNAIAMGPVKIGCAGDQLQNVPGMGNRNGWFATGFRQDGNIDHCTALCGYGPMGWLAQQLGGTLPAGVNTAAPGYALFTWGGVGIIDVPSMLNITAEAWLRTPNTVQVGTNPPTPDPPAFPVPGPTPPPPPPPPPPTTGNTLTLKITVPPTNYQIPGGIGELNITTAMPPGLYDITPHGTPPPLPPTPPPSPPSGVTLAEAQAWVLGGLKALHTWRGQVLLKLAEMVAVKALADNWPK